MLLYHIADLHLGKSISGLSLLEDQRHWIDEFLKHCDLKKPGAVLIAGDVYDKVNPSGDAVELLGYFLTELESRDLPVFMIAGNHDSGLKLQYLQTILKKRNIHIAGKASKEISHYTMDDPDGYGPVTFWMLPFVFPQQVAGILDDEDIKTYTEAIAALIAKQEIDKNHRNIILSHQNVVKNGIEVEFGGSETAVGGLGAVEYSVYDDFDYVALGHIHSGFEVGRPSVRYAGTPLCYHFDETKFEETIGKGFLEVVVGEKGTEIKPSVVKIEPLHKMHPILGTREEAYDEVNNRVGENEYVKVTITDMLRTSEMENYLRSVIDSKNSLLLEMESTYREFSSSKIAVTSKDIEEKSIESLFSDFYKSRMNDNEPTEEEKELIDFLGELIRNEKELTDEAAVEKILKQLLGEKGEE